MPTQSQVVFALLMSLLALSLPMHLDAQTGGASTSGTIVGQVVDANTGAPIANANVRIRELGRNDLSHADGSFHFLDLAARSYTIIAQRIGFVPLEQRVTLGPGESLDLLLSMTATALELSGVVVTGTGRERRAGETFQPTQVVGDVELRRRLEPSVAATIDRLPGISQQYNGPAASQPVIRGMGGDRVLVLEDGQRTGDLSTTAADHAVTIDPITVQRIEVVRGPAGLLYGSNALGGVVNVVREEVPRSVPESVAGTFSVQGETVNGGVAGGGTIVVPHGGLAVRGELSGRTASDTRTPAGSLEGSEIQGYGGGFGASWVASWGFFGAAVRDQALDYGVPGEFQGELIPGAHPEGVGIETRRQTARVEGGHFSGFGPISSVSLDANLTYYQHRELEGGQGNVTGARFSNTQGGGDVIFRHEHEIDRLFTEGAFGFSGSSRELRTSGGFTGSRDARAHTAAAYIYEEFAMSPVRFQIGGRYDWTRVTPQDLTPIATDEGEIAVRDRTFNALSGSVAALVELTESVTLGASLARAFRTPSVEELFSDGPHLADYSYDIGNPDLAPEIGVGGDIFLRVGSPAFQGELNVFRNSISNYIHYAPTAQLDPRFGRFPVFVAEGADALFEGAEAGIQWEVVRGLVVDGTVSYVRANRTDTDDPLPAIPPLNSSAEVRYEHGAFFASAGWRGAQRQDRVTPAFESPVTPGEQIVPERPTAGYQLIDVGGGVRWELGERLHTLTLQVDNVTDTEWRDHLSRIKEVAPQPGRNIQILYRVQI